MAKIILLSCLVLLIFRLHHSFGFYLLAQQPEDRFPSRQFNSFEFDSMESLYPTKQQQQVLFDQPDLSYDSWPSSIDTSHPLKRRMLCFFNTVTCFG